MDLDQTDPFSQRVHAGIEQECSNHRLAVKGSIPHWLTGTLVRNGPIPVSVNGQTNAHWFDGLAMLHAFSFQEGTVCYSNRFLRTDAYRAVFEKQSLDYPGFAIDPCRSLFKRFFNLFLSSFHVPIQNANVNVASIAHRYVALTEVPLPVEFDLETLETLGVLDFQDELPQKQCWESAHPHFDSETKETYNYLIQFGKNSLYTFYRLEEGSAERKIVAQIPVEKPAYMHSFALTENYLILTEFPFVIKPIDLLLKNKAFIKNFHWCPERGTRIQVISRNDGEVVAHYQTRPFFAFHHANAFEEGKTIHLDLVTYPDASVLEKEILRIDHSSSLSPQTQFERVSLSLETGQVSSQVLFQKFPEFPRINETRDGRPYRYVYLAGFTEKDPFYSEALYKLDTKTKQVDSWKERGCCPGEPVFVPAPFAKEEDGGVILSVVIDPNQKTSFLLVLDAKSFQEIGRIAAPHLIPIGLHGQYFQ